MEFIEEEKKIIIKNIKEAGSIDYNYKENEVNITINLAKRFINKENIEVVINYLGNYFVNKTIKILDNNKSFFTILPSLGFFKDDGYYTKLYYNLSKIDNEFTSAFSITKTFFDDEEYIDLGLKDKYYHNFLYSDNIDNINKYVLSRYEKGYEFANIYTNKKIDFDFNFINENNYDHLIHFVGSKKEVLNNYIKKDIDIKKVTKENSDLFLSFLYLENKRFGDDYSKRNAIRYTEVVLDGKLDYYLAMKDGIIIGYLSAFLYKDIVKLEDFYILKSYRENGYGSYLFKSVLRKYDVDYVYVLAEKESEASKIYAKYNMVMDKDLYFYNILFKK